MTFLHIRAGDFIPVSKSVLLSHRIHYFIYMAFNLDPLVLDEVSFCIKEGATALDVLAISYVTFLYSFFLIIILIIVMTKCNVTRCIYTLLSRKRAPHKLNLHVSVIHGLGTFLVLTYANCVHASIMILSPTYIYSKGYEWNRTVVYLNGNIIWMSIQHLQYALPAAMLLILVSIPPLLLLVYPLHYRVLSLLKISETRCVNIIFSPLEKLKPFMDSFQSCFKDEYRFFSGLYFVYRFLFLVTMILKKLEQVYLLLECQLAIMLILNGVCRPYKKQLHNVIDTLLFGNLALIHAITAYNFSCAKTYKLFDASFTAWIQSILILSPLVIALFCLIAKSQCSKKICNRIWRRHTSEIALEEDEFPARLVHYGAIAIVQSS